MIEERFDPDRTILSLEFIKKRAIKNQATKTENNREKIRNYLMKNGLLKTSDIADYINLSPARTRAILSEMDDVESVGENKNRRYKINN